MCPAHELRQVVELGTGFEFAEAGLGDADPPGCDLLRDVGAVGWMRPEGLHHLAHVAGGKCPLHGGLVPELGGHLRRCGAVVTCCFGASGARGGAVVASQPRAAAALAHLATRPHTVVPDQKPSFSPRTNPTTLRRLMMGGYSFRAYTIIPRISAHLRW